VNSARDGKTVIKIWLAQHPFPDYLLTPREIAEEFGRAHPEYHVELTGYDFREIPRRVVDAVRSGSQPDIAEYYYTAAQLARDTRAADGGPLFTSVQAAVDGRATILGEPVLLDDIIPAARDYYTYRGDLSSVPATVTTTLLFTNMTMLGAAGLAEPPRTWQEVENTCGKLAGSAGGPPYGITWPNHGWLFQQAIAEQGGLLADHNNGRSGRAQRVHLASAELMAYVRWWKRLHANGHYLYTARPWDWMPVIEAFLSGQTAFLLTSSATAGLLIQAGRQAGFDVGVSQLPRAGHVPYAGHMVSGQSLWLTGGLDTRKQDGALAFMQYLLNPGNAARWHKAQGFVPATEAAFRLLDDEGWFGAAAEHRVATEQLRASDRSAAALGAVLGDFAGIQHLMTAAMHDVLVRDSDPEARFSRAAREAQEMLDAYNARCAGERPQSPEHLDVA
jgi:sn-glycerol 3-phosphate transport system substrate-binding protein